MNPTVDSPTIVLFEDRPKQAMVFQLNLSIYLDARVLVATNIKDLKKHLAAPEGVHLVVARAQYKGKAIVGKILDVTDQEKTPVQVICLGDETARTNLTLLNSDNEVKPLLQNAARILGITAKHMVSKQRPVVYDISAEFLNLLFTFPCDVFDKEEKVFSAGDAVSRKKITKYINSKKNLTIESMQRLKLVNAVTEQCLKASDELNSTTIAEDKKMSILSASLDMVAAQFQNSGMDEETVKLANASIKAVEKIAESATNVGNLVKQLMEAEGGYRYAHCQLLTFLGFHVIKMMGWWGDDQRSIISQASFYHDISLKTDEESKIRSQKLLTASGIKDVNLIDRILAHPQLAARELQTAPEISPEVVRVVIQHHGSPVGKGFSTDIGKLDNLAKTFIMSEEWADYLIGLSETDAQPDNEAKIKELKTIYKDDLCGQIVETFRYLDPSEFNQDFLSNNEVDFAASLISGGGAGSEAESVVVPVASDEAEPETLVKGTAAEAEPETIVKGAKAETEVSTKVTGVTQHIEQEKIKINGWTKTEEEELTKLKASTDEKSKELVLKFEAKKKKVKEKEAEVLKKAGWGEAEEKAVEKLREAKDEKSKELLKKFEAKKAKAEEALAVKAKEEEEEEKKQKIEGVTHHHKDEEINVKGTAAEEEVKTKINSVTHHHKDEDIKVKGTAAEEEAKTKINGVTDVRLDEKIVIKGEPQKYVDNSIKVIKSDEQKERELKMKALAGSTDLMKLAVAGQLDKIQEMLKENASVELRKTDAEGRTAIHYAAMGGAIPVMKFLTEKGAQINTADSKRRTPLFFAALYKHNEAFDFILGAGGKINQQAMGGMTVAMVAAFSGNMHILKIAVEKGVRLDTRDHSGKTALDMAKQGKHAEAITFIESTISAATAAAAAATAAKKPKTNIGKPPASAPAAA